MKPKPKNNLPVIIIASVVSLSLIILGVVFFVMTMSPTSIKYIFHSPQQTAETSASTPIAQAPPSTPTQSTEQATTTVQNFGDFATTYSFYYDMPGQNQSLLVISPNGEVTQYQSAPDNRVFHGSATIVQDNQSVLSYEMNSRVSNGQPNTKTINSNVIIHVIWDNGGGQQDYYGYYTYIGGVALTDGDSSNGGVNEVWLQK